MYEQVKSLDDILMIKSSSWLISAWNPKLSVAIINLNYSKKLKDIKYIEVERGPFGFWEREVEVKDKEGKCTRLFMYFAI